MKSFIRLIVAAFLTGLIGAAHAQTAANRATLETQNNTFVYTNGQGAITAATLNPLLGNYAASMATLLDANVFLSTQTYLTAPIFASLTGYCYANGSSPITCSTSINGAAITGTNTLGLSLLQQIPQRSVLGNQFGAQGNVVAPWTVPNSTDTIIPLVHGAVTSGDYACYSDSLGTLKDCGPIADNFAATAPISVSFPSRIPTFALNYDANFTVSANELALAPIAAGALLGNSSGIIAEPAAVQTGSGVLAALENPLNGSGGVLSTSLASGDLFIGNGSGIAAGVPMSGDATISNTGALTLAASGVTAGTYGDATHSTQVTFDAKGRATSASSVTITHASGDLPLSGGTMSGPIVPLVIGHTFYADQYGTFHDFVHDDAAPIQAAINAAAAAGGTVVLGPYAYWIDSASLSVPRGVTLTCGSYYQPPSRVSGGGVANYQNAPCSLYFASGNTLLNSGEVSKVNIFADLVHFTPMDASSTRAQMEAYIASFTGTGITIGNGTLGSAYGGIVRNVAIGGFAKCIDVGQAGQLKLIDILGDCTNGMSVTQSYDDDFLRGVEFWPFLTANLTHVADSWAISSIADNGSGLWRLTLSAATNITTGEQLWVNPGTTAQGAAGFWTVTAIDSTHVDLQGSASAPTTTANTVNGQTYMAVASRANLQPGMAVSGPGIPAGATIGTVWRNNSAISLDQSHPATATATGVTLTFGSTPYTSGGTLNYDGAFRFGTAFALGRADGLTCNACFAFGYQIGFNLNDAFGLSLVNTQVDNNGQIAANQNVTPIGIEFTGSNAYGNFISGSLITSDGVNILSNVSNTPGSYANTVEGFRTAGSAPLPSTAVEIDNGALIVQGLQDGGAHTIAIAPAAGTSVLTANQLAATIVFSPGSPNWQGAGNNLGGIAGLNSAPATALGDIVVTSSSTADAAPLTINGSNNVDGAGIKFIGNGSTTPNKSVRAFNGVLQWLNSAYSAAIMTMDDIGDLTIVGAFKAASGQFTGLNTPGIVTNDPTGQLGTEAGITPAQCPAATTSAQGCVEPDGTTIVISAGKLTAVGAAATSIDAGGATSITNGTPNTVLTNNAGKVGTGISTSDIASLSTAQTIPGDKTFTGTNTAPTQAARDNSTKLATTAYADADSTFGAWVTDAISTVYQASTDGFVIVDALSNTNSSLVSCITDSNPSPSTIRNEGQASLSNYHIGCMTPVRKGDYWKVTTNGVSSSSVYWLPRGN